MSEAVKRSPARQSCSLHGKFESITDRTFACRTIGSFYTEENIVLRFGSPSMQIEYVLENIYQVGDWHIETLTIPLAAFEPFPVLEAGHNIESPFFKMQILDLEASNFPETHTGCCAEHTGGAVSRILPFDRPKLFTLSKSEDLSSHRFFRNRFDTGSRVIGKFAHFEGILQRDK